MLKHYFLILMRIQEYFSQKSQVIIGLGSQKKSFNSINQSFIRLILAQEFVQLKNTKK